MTDPELTQRVREHYARRAFSPALVARLCAEIDRRSGDAGVEIAKGWSVPTGPLLEAFAPIDQSPRPAVLHPSPAAIFTLSFGYRLDSPFARTAEERRPGPNNEALATMTGRCQRLFPDAWTAVQHEVAVALRERGAPEPALVTPALDWETHEVIAHFAGRLAEDRFASNRKVIVVCHLHHYGRCAGLLKRAGIEAFAPPKEVAAYADYDAEEAQPRYRSPWEYLVNDFLSICKEAGVLKTAARKHLVAV